MKNRWWSSVTCLVLAGCGNPESSSDRAASESGSSKRSTHRTEARQPADTPPLTDAKATQGASTTSAGLPDIPIGWGPLLEALPRAFGKPINGAEVAAVVKAAGGEPKMGRSDDGRLTLYWDDKGLSLAFGKDRTLTSGTFSGGKSMWNSVLDNKVKPYPGALPYGLKWEDGPAAVEQKLGKPDPSPTEYAVAYKRLGLRLGFVNRENGQGTQLDELILGIPGTVPSRN